MSRTEQNVPGKIKSNSEQAHVDRQARSNKNGPRPAIPFWRLVRPRVGFKRFFRDLWAEIQNDNVFDSAAVLAYFSMLAIFPAAILLLSLLPYLPIPNLEQTILASMHKAMPPQAADLFTSTVQSVVSERRGSLLSLGVLGTLWAASSGIQAVMQRINATLGLKETRPYWKIRGIAIALVFLVGTLVVTAFSLLIVGNIVHEHLARVTGENSWLLWFYLALRWAIILLSMLSAFSLLYYFGPSVKQHFRFLTPGGVLATALFLTSSLLFRVYVENFGSYEATYGSLGAAIVLMLWLYVGGIVLLVGAEVNGLLETYARRSDPQT